MGYPSYNPQVVAPTQSSTPSGYGPFQYGSPVQAQSSPEYVAHTPGVAEALSPAPGPVTTPKSNSKDIKNVTKDQDKTSQKPKVDKTDKKKGTSNDRKDKHGKQDKAQTKAEISNRNGTHGGQEVGSHIRDKDYKHDIEKKAVEQEMVLGKDAEEKREKSNESNDEDNTDDDEDDTEDDDDNYDDDNDDDDDDADDADDNDDYDANADPVDRLRKEHKHNATDMFNVSPAGASSIPCAPCGKSFIF